MLSTFGIKSVVPFMAGESEIGPSRSFTTLNMKKERNLAWEEFMNMEKDPGLDIAAFDMGSDKVIV